MSWMWSAASWQLAVALRGAGEVGGGHHKGNAEDEGLRGPRGARTVGTRGRHPHEARASSSLTLTLTMMFFRGAGGGLRLRVVAETVRGIGVVGTATGMFDAKSDGVWV